MLAFEDENVLRDTVATRAILPAHELPLELFPVDLKLVGLRIDVFGFVFELFGFEVEMAADGGDSMALMVSMDHALGADECTFAFIAQVH